MGTEARLTAVSSMGTGSEITVAHQAGGGLEVRRLGGAEAWWLGGPELGGADVWWLGGPERGSLLARRHGTWKCGGPDLRISLTCKTVVFVVALL